jgi:hypothetical protein
MRSDLLINQVKGIDEIEAATDTLTASGSEKGGSAASTNPI